LCAHKLLRLLVPWALLALLGLSATLDGPLYRAAFWSQTFCYLLGLAGLWRPIGSRSRAASAAASFLVVNAAAWLAFWVWASGRSARSWNKIAYDATPGQSPAPVVEKTVEHYSLDYS
jgi:poly-beta-1,6-N-acetyl-D-glucosamine synthase